MKEFVPAALNIMLINEDKEVLMLHRDDIPHIYFPNVWCTFGGGLKELDMVDGWDYEAKNPEYYQSLENGILREVGREVNTVKEGHQRLFTPEKLELIYEGRYVDATQDIDQFFYSAPLYEKLEHLVLGEEGQDIGLFNRSDILSMNIAANYGQLCIQYMEEAHDLFFK